MTSFISKYKTQIISIITAISALALALTSLGGEVTRVCEIVIAIDAVLIAILKTGFDNKFVDNSVALLKLLQEQYDITPTAQPVTPSNIAGAGKEEDPGVIRIINKDGTITEIPTGASSTVDEHIEETKPTDKLTDEQLKDLVESYLIKAGLVKGKTYFKEMYASDVEKKFGLDLSKLSNDGKAEKRFDFVFVGALGTVFACECNFYGSSGSKLNETARSYKTLTLEAKDITGFQFVWFTDGIGWNSAKNNLEETFDVLDNLYNLQDLENGAINNLIDSTKYLKHLLM